MICYKNMSCYEFLMYIISCDYYDRKHNLDLDKSLLEECNIDPPPLTENSIDTKFDDVDNIMFQYENSYYGQTRSLLKSEKAIQLLNNIGYIPPINFESHV